MDRTSLDELQWKSPEWIQSFGLRTDNVLDYFSQSPFFDRTSNNQVAKMQQQFAQPRAPSQAPSISEFDNESPHRKAILSTYLVHAMWEQELRKLKGIEYVLAYVREPDFWIIRKQNRQSPTHVETLQDYFIIGANVYQSPAVAKIVQSRLSATNFHLTRALSTLRSMGTFRPSQGASFADRANQPQISSQSGSTTGSTMMTGNSVGPATANGQSGPTSSTDLLNSSGSQTDLITPDLMDRLLVTSMKSSFKYI
ncbi:LAMI_0D04544g1_1 [Lachancea mirantina]|uniref:Mediator of RNA polymerase II transcription subunit 6 n=1 Tax=Lachancea mirantina TaxID=1230905 RepID=A0A1G4JAK4_9SACH|nr:LAMI_0D04544g1_1 [Lachancea mirantina]